MTSEMGELIKTLEEGLVTSWYDWIVLGVSILIAIANVWIVNINTNKQIKAQNKETYRPRLGLKELTLHDFESEARYLYAYSKEYQEENNNKTFYVDLELENIGNGIANDISFYMLTNGEKCYSYQYIEEAFNQKMNSTLEIPKDRSKIVKFSLNFNIDTCNNEEEKDFVLLICNYKDLNNNNYKMLIGIILKKYAPLKEDTNGVIAVGPDVYGEATFNSYYYQEETEAFKSMTERELYKKYYEKIIKTLGK